MRYSRVRPLMLVALTCPALPACITDVTTDLASDIIAAQVDALENSADQRYATDLLSAPTQKWANALPAEHVPTDEEMGLALVHLASLRTLDATGLIPIESITTELPLRIQFHTADYPSVFRQGDVKQTGVFDLPFDLAPQGGCDASCDALPDLEATSSRLEACLHSERSLTQLRSAWSDVDLDTLWQTYVDASPTTPTDSIPAITAAATGHIDEISAALTAALVRGIADITVARSVVAVFSIQSAFQCSHEENQLISDYQDCVEWQERRCER